MVIGAPRCTLARLERERDVFEEEGRRHTFEVGRRHVLDEERGPGGSLHVLDEGEELLEELLPPRIP